MEPPPLPENVPQNSKSLSLFLYIFLSRLSLTRNFEKKKTLPFLSLCFFFLLFPDFLSLSLVPNRKRLLQRSSSPCMDSDDVVEIPPPIHRTPKLQKNKEVRSPDYFSSLFVCFINHELNFRRYSDLSGSIMSL